MPPSPTASFKNGANKGNSRTTTKAFDSAMVWKLSLSEYLDQVTYVLLTEIQAAIKEYEQLIGGYASYTHQMLDRLGPVAALTRLMSDGKIQKGLKTLAKAGRLELTFEAIVVRHPECFSKSTIEAAEWRLQRARRGDFE